jgi:hypothetical protein
MKFEIDFQYLTSIIIRKEWGSYDHIPADKLTHEQLITILKGEDRCSSVSSEDHPEFAKLRDSLEEQGYIKTERCSWNGDRVIKDFTLCGSKFKVGERFPSSAAMPGHLKYWKKNRRKGL